MYIVNLSKKRFTDSLSYLRNCGFYILLFESFFSGHGDPALPGYWPLHRPLYPVCRWEGGLHLHLIFYLLHDMVQEIEIYGTVLATHQEGQ